MKKTSKREDPFTKRLRQLMQDRGWSFEDLQTKIVEYKKTSGDTTPLPSLGTMYNWNNGQMPSTDKLKLLALIFGVSVDFLIGLSDRIGNVDLTKLPQSCLRSVAATESTVVMPDGTKRKVINVKDSIMLDEVQ